MIRVDADRVYVRPLLGSDIGMHYVHWFEDEKVRRFIKYARGLPTLEDLRDYWQKMDRRTGVEFLGIFLNMGDRHIGNIKYETGPASDEMHVGFLIGNSEYRGKGILGEVLDTCSQLVMKKYQLRRLYLTVDPNNKAGIRAFAKLGYVNTGKIDSLGDLEMDFAGQ